MLLVRWVVLLLLLAAAIFFALYGATGRPKYKRIGVAILKWTLVATFGFGVVLFIQRLVS